MTQLFVGLARWLRPAEWRRALHVGGGAVAAAIGCVVVGAGGLAGSLQPQPTMVSLILLADLAVLVVAVVTRRMRFSPPSVRAQRASFWLARAPAFADIEMALALALGSYAVIDVSGGAESMAYPLVYGVVAFSMTFQSRIGAVALLAAVLGLEWAGFARGATDSAALATTAMHTVFILAASVSHALFLRGLVARQRRQQRATLERQVQEQTDAARDFRLISSALGADSRAPRSRSEEESMLAAGGAQTIHASVYYNLGLLKRSLDARTCILLWLEPRGGGLRICELVTDGDSVVESPRVRISGVIGAIVHDRTPMLLDYAKPSQVAYIETGASVGAFAGVPVLDGPHLRGVLCADRAQPFTERDVELLSETTEQVLRAIQAEHVFRAVERSKYEHERFYQASAMLCQALTIEQVMETAFDAAAQIVGYDIAAITTFDAQRKRHRIYSTRVHKDGAGMVSGGQFTGLEYRDNSGLAAMVVKNKHYLPAAGERRDSASPVYTKKLKFKDAESLLVLPLLSADEAIGTMMLMSRKEHRFTKDVREMLAIIANQVAVSLQNAMMYKKMETMATTDGLTGLTNHRTFQERFAELIERAERHDHRAAVLLCDVDHFKNVNDTYGHPVGDEVLRRVARVLQDAVRKIDIPARYGGEEFAVVLEATDLEGALGLAERIRTDVAAMVMESDKGSFRVNMSIGVSVFPDDATERADLIERADHALYHAKETGRNRVISYQTFDAARRARRAS